MENRIAHWAFDEGHGRETKDSVTGLKDGISYSLEKGRFQAPRHPEWKRGIQGHALSFDGYSTHIRRGHAAIGQPKETLTITAWIAPRTYDFGADNQLSAIVGQQDRERGQGFVLGLFRHGAWSFQLGHGGVWTEVWCEEPIPLNGWSFVAAVYDGSTGELSLYLNGKRKAVVTAGVPTPMPITPCEADLLIGRNPNGSILAESFIMNHFSGLMDELTLYGEALSEAELQARYEAALAPYGGVAPLISPADMELPRHHFANDRHRPAFHLSPPGHWMNEPHAPLYFNGQYHLFYQRNPQGPFWHYIHWGHWVSEDLVHWRDLPPALRPEPGLDPDGIWSGGAAIGPDGLPVLFYTAGDFRATPTQSVALARSTFAEDGDPDLTHWVKHPKPVVEQEEGPGRLYGEFRDPYVWCEDGVYYMLVGSGTGDEGRGGTAFVYTSDNLTDWTSRGPLFVSDYDKYPYLGVAWELPVLLPLRQNGRESGKHVLLISPWGDGAKVEVNYWIGVWDRAACRFTPSHEEPGLIDVGDFHFTGPSGMVDPKTGRSIVFTIAQGERTPEIDYDCGWAHCGGLPVSLYLREDGRLGVEPIEETQLLRGRKLLSISGLSVEEANKRLAELRGDMLEIKLEFGQAAGTCGIAVRRTPDGEEETVILFNRSSQQLFADRTKSTLDRRERTRGVQGGVLPIEDEALRLHLFVDRSLIECYANGMKSLTTRTYPSRTDALGLELRSGQAEVRVHMEVWDMNAAFPSNLGT